MPEIDAGTGEYAIAAEDSGSRNCGILFGVIKIYTYKNNLRMNEIQCDIKAQCLNGGVGNCREGHSNKELKKFRKTIKRLEVEADALNSFLGRI